MIGTILNDRYLLEAELGRGGMGVVYRARDTLLERQVAVKIMVSDSLEASSSDRIMREARAAASLNHPNIVSVYDVGRMDQSGQSASYIVMELVEGHSLRNHRPQTLDQVIDIALAICAALEEAHTNGIIHRDLKPENVILTDTQAVKLMDFGLARVAAAPRITEKGALVGTLSYLAPELIMGQAASPQSDLYALGLLLYELATGRPPFEADSLAAVLSQHLNAPVVPPSTYNDDIPPLLDALIIQLLNKRPGDRPASAASVRRTLELLKQAEDFSASTVAWVKELTLLDRIARGRMVGRDAELAEAMALWQRALAREGGILLVSGEPGIGKTRLVHELVARANMAGATLWSGGCYEYEATTPYLPLAEALREWVHVQSAESLKDQLGATAPELARLAPEIEEKLGRLEPNPSLSPQEERLRLFNNFARLLETLAGPSGLLLFIDDLHWADQGTLAMISYLLRRMARERLLIVAAYRESELTRTHPLAASLVEWNRERLATRITLSRLAVTTVNTMLATMFGQTRVSDEFAEAIYSETEGNPFFIEEVVKALIEQGQIYRQNDRWQRTEIPELAIPQSIKEAIGRRLNRLGRACVDMLHTASALGKSFAFEKLAAVAVLGEDHLLDALDEAAAAQLIRAESSETFIFTHDKIREVLYEELNPVRRRRLHLRIGAALEEIYSPTIDRHVQELAYHFVEGGDLRRGLHYSLRAAEDSFRLFASADALRFYGDARECARTLDLPGQVAEIDELMADIYGLSGPFPLAIEHYDRALEYFTTPEKQAALKSKIGATYARMGDERGLELLTSLLDVLDPESQGNVLADALTTIGRFHHFRAQYSQAIDHYERARRLAEPLDDPPTITFIYAYLAGAYQQLTRFRESVHWARKSIDYGERLNYPMAVGLGQEFLGEDCALMGKWPETLEAADRDYESGEKTGSQDRKAWAMWCRGSALHGQGDLQGAAVAYGRALQIAEHIGNRRLATLICTYLSRAKTDLGSQDAALVEAGRALESAAELGEVLLKCESRHALGYLHLQRGEWDPALEHYEQIVELLSDTENRAAALVSRPYHAEACLGHGDLDEAAAIASAAVTLAHQAGSRHYEAVAHRVQGQILAVQECWPEADQAYDFAVDTLDRLGSRLELGRALYYRAMLRRATGKGDAARSDANRAMTLFQNASAPRDRDRAAAFLES